MDKITNFGEWIVTVMELFDINKNYVLGNNNETPKITIEQFINLALKTPGWQQVIMTTGDYICVNNLYKHSYELTDGDLNAAKKQMIKYFEDFAISACKAGYVF